MAKRPDWNDVHRATPGAVRGALTEPDIPFDDARAAQQGNGAAHLSEEELRGKREPLEVNSEAAKSSYTNSPISNGHANNPRPKIDPDRTDEAIRGGDNPWTGWSANGGSARTGFCRAARSQPSICRCLGTMARMDRSKLGTRKNAQDI